MIGWKILVVVFLAMEAIVGLPSETKKKEEDMAVTVVTMSNSSAVEKKTPMPDAGPTAIVNLKEKTTNAYVNVPKDFANAFLPMVRYFYSLVGLVTNRNAVANNNKVSRFPCSGPCLWQSTCIAQVVCLYCCEAVSLTQVCLFGSWNCPECEEIGTFTPETHC